MSVIHINKDNFEELVLKAEKPVLLDFWATWCGPCMRIAPYVEALAEEREDIVVGKIDVDDQPQLAARFGITSIPTLVVMDKGRVVTQALGFRTKEAIEKLLDQ